MEVLFHDFEQAQIDGAGPLLSTTLTPIAPPEDPRRLQRFYNASNSASIVSDLRAGLLAHGRTQVRFSKGEGNAWIDVYAAYWKAVGEISAIEEGTRSDWSRVYEAWKEVANAIIKGYSGSWFSAWTVPCLYVAGRFLRIFAIKADDHARAVKPLVFDTESQDDIGGDISGNHKLEDAARVINRIFTLCISDRAPIEDSRKWGIYYTTNLLFKTYFKLNSISLSKNILRALHASHTDLPPMEAFPKSHIVTFKYYVGVILFLEENYAKAEEYLDGAWQMCHRDARRNKELILTYLIPCHLLTTHTLPTAHLLAPYPRLQSLFNPLAQAIRSGDLAAFDAALAAGEAEFVSRRIYLTLERGRDVALRNLLRKVYLLGGFEEPAGGGPPVRRTRVPVAEFVAAVRVGSQARPGRVEGDEVECLLANMIYKNLIKGYIARDRGIVVLSKGSAFPGTGV